MSWLWDQPLSNRTNLCKVLDVLVQGLFRPTTLLGLGFYTETHNLLKQQLQEYPLLTLVRSHNREESCFVDDVKRLHTQLY
jgi:hypothetical protein